MFQKIHVAYKKEFNVKRKNVGSIHLTITRLEDNDISIHFRFIKGPSIVEDILIKDSDVPYLTNILRILLESYTIKTEEQTFVNKIWHDIFVKELPTIVHINGKSIENPLIKHFPDYWNYLKEIYGPR